MPDGVVRAVLVHEGPTDALLAPHLEQLCVFAGAREASCRVPRFDWLKRPPGRAVRDQCSAALRMFPETNLLFIHRDADAVGPDARRAEIVEAVGGLANPPHHVPVIPVTAIEAWLLVDAAAVRRAVGARDGVRSVTFPRGASVEAISDPKDVLRSIAASLQTHRSRRHHLEFSTVRRRLLERMDVGPSAPVRSVPAFVRLVTDIDSAVTLLG